MVLQRGEISFTCYRSNSCARMVFIPIIIHALKPVRLKEWHSTKAFSKEPFALWWREIWTHTHAHTHLYALEISPRTGRQTRDKPTQLEVACFATSQYRCSETPLSAKLRLMWSFSKKPWIISPGDWSTEHSEPLQTRGVCTLHTYSPADTHM